MDEATFTAILDGIQAGESAKSCLRSVEINPRTFWARLGSDEDAANRYARARARGLDRLAEEILDIADDEEIPADSRRVRIDPRKWLLSKLAPKKYGDKTTTEHTGEGGGPIESRVIIEFAHSDTRSVRVPVGEEG